MDRGAWQTIVHGATGFPSGSDAKASVCNAGDPGSIPGWEDPLVPPMNPASQALGKGDLEDLFSGVVSTELGLSLETQTNRGRKTTCTSLCSLGEL